MLHKKIKTQSKKHTHFTQPQQLIICASPELSSLEHPQSMVFGKFAEPIVVGINKNASIAVINPSFSGLNFGSFYVPTCHQVVNQKKLELLEVTEQWSLSRYHSEKSRIALVPPETGRALLLDSSPHKVWRDVLVKGVGLIERFTANNKLRFASRGFDGWLELSEAERDLVNSEILRSAGVLVAAPLGVVDHKHIHQYTQFSAWTGNYIRAFRCQTRISNLFELDLPTRKSALLDAIAQMKDSFQSNDDMVFAEYFQRILEICARNVAIMQAIGYTQDGLHYGQISLCGELADFGVGNFRRPQQSGVINSIYPWFRYERQPILMQNILYKTHAVKAEPFPVELKLESRAVQEQATLFGAIRSISPKAAAAIAESTPDIQFWKIYEKTYRSFFYSSFKANVLDKVADYYSWRPEAMLEKIPSLQKRSVQEKYKELLSCLNEHFEKQVSTWDRRGAMSLHKQKIFAEAVQFYYPNFELSFSEEASGVWSGQNLQPYLLNNDCDNNKMQDISWKPSFVNC